MDNKTEALREKFEAWAVSERELDITPNPVKNHDFYYADIMTEDHWQTWQAASEIKAPQMDVDRLLNVCRDYMEGKYHDEVIGLMAGFDEDLFSALKPFEAPNPPEILREEMP